MNTHDEIELPPLPGYDGRIDGQWGAFHLGTMQAYARAAIEAYRKRRGEPVSDVRNAALEEAASLLEDRADVYAYSDGPARYGRNWAEAIRSLKYDATPQPAEPVKVPSDAIQRDATGETWMGIRVAAYQWEIDNDFGKMTRHAMHWSTGPATAERLYSESDIRALLARYGQPVEPEGWKLVPVEPTREMLDAYVAQDDRFHYAHSDWATMLEAAPKFGEGE